MTIIGIGHTARVGKDTAAHALVRDLGYTRIGFADALKELAMEVDPMVLRMVGAVNVRPNHGTLKWVVQTNGWEDAKQKTPEIRRILQNLGVGCRRVFGEDVWVDRVMRKAQSVEKLVIPDVRFPNEAEAIKAAGGYLVKIERNVYLPLGGTHESETALLDFDGWDLVIPNHGTITELETEIVTFARRLELDLGRTETLHGEPLGEALSAPETSLTDDAVPAGR